ncbi:MAG: ParB N-terminal domain-containing protein [Eubacterium sp.]|nr:ParB N-terminal domain-containing protein [Eubacterium sp.]
MAKKRTFDTAILNDIKTVAGDSYADSIKMLPIDQLHENSENFYDISDLDTLIEDIDRQGLKTPLYVVPDDNGEYTIISGHRRRAAVQELINGGKYGTDKLPCYIGSRKSEAETMLDLIMLNATSRVISDAETVKQCEKLEEVFKTLEADGKKVQGRMRDKIAAALNVSPAQVGKVENIRHNAIEEVKAAVDEGKMSISTANEIAKLKPEKQKNLVEKKKPEKITHKEVKKSVEAAKDKQKTTTPKQQIQETVSRLENNEDITVDEINKISDVDSYEDGSEDITFEDYENEKNAKSDNLSVIMPTAEEDAKLREKAVASAKAAAELWKKPPEYFNEIIDSGMCNSIISGYVLLVLEEMGIECPADIFRIINRILDFKGAQAARDKFSDN